MRYRPSPLLECKLEETSHKCYNVFYLPRHSSRARPMEVPKTWHMFQEFLGGSLHMGGRMQLKRFYLFPAALLLMACSILEYRNSFAQDGKKGMGTEVLNPYEKVDWGTFEYIHSFSHQHGNRPPAYTVSPETFWNMGYRHLPFSNYYPSSPAPLPEDFRKKHPDALWAPNAEQHSSQGIGHFNVIDSYFSTGYGEAAKTSYRRNRISPVEYEFTGLNSHDPEKPWLSIYWLELIIGGGEGATLSMTVDGALEASPSTYELKDSGVIKNRKIPAKRTNIYVRAESDRVRVRFEFNPGEIEDLRFSIKQGVYRPWEDAFRAALDGTREDRSGKPVEGLRFPDGGGITLNHTAAPVASVLEKLNFDPRVLGIEIWNQHEGFGPKGTLGFYKLWDEVLKTGTRCFGFFVKDHFIYERGRNVLLLPPSRGLSVQERERNAAKAYRNGVFYGLMGALAVDEKGQKISPYDYSDFRFTKISLKKDKTGIPESLEVSVDGADKVKRPNVQIRFVTDKGVSLVENKSDVSYKLTKDGEGGIVERYIRVEAYAYPSTHLQGKPLIAEEFTKMNVMEICRIHDFLGGGYQGIYKYDRDNPAPVPIVDMIFSQPIMFR